MLATLIRLTLLHILSRVDSLGMSHAGRRTAPTMTSPAPPTLHLRTFISA